MQHVQFVSGIFAVAVSLGVYVWFHYVCRGDYVVVIICWYVSLSVCYEDYSNCCGWDIMSST